MWDRIYAVTDFLWGTPLMILMVGVGFYLSLRTGFFQITGIRTWWKMTVGEIFGKTKSEGSNKEASAEGEMKPFQAMATVMAGTVGSGNIAGVATAIAAGGPGAVFWMWLISLVGMMTKMAEVTLSVAYRKKNEDGEYFGGPMHYMKSALGKAGGVLAGFYAVALLIEVLADACFVQTNTLAVCVNDVYGIPMVPIALVVVGISAVIIFRGGVKKIGDFCGEIGVFYHWLLWVALGDPECIGVRGSSIYWVVHLTDRHSSLERHVMCLLLNCPFSIIKLSTCL